MLSGQASRTSQAGESCEQRIAELRKEGQWSASRLPKLQEACRPKSHWDTCWRRCSGWRLTLPRKGAGRWLLPRSLCAHVHVTMLNRRRWRNVRKREEEMRLRHIASTIARGVDYFWSNIEQVVEIKLRFEIYDKRQKVLGLQKAVSKGQCAKVTQSTGEKSDKESKGQETGISRKRKSSTSLSDVEVHIEDEESTIEDQEAVEVAADQKAELAELTKEGK
ncbi:E1A-binding protein p400-like [Carassius auratus]|uniref:E1A-binding protein p400-like n=1 Tax=Carassius auratus TaxID=7957 RepID=A0A6P6PZF3_CARAU|nr:E1A-binding protein p400-like [Carassius auratus]